MLLKEMFSAIGAPKDEEQEVDWISDLKFYIDNSDDALSNYFFPAIKKHEEWRGHPDAYKLYLKPLESCKEEYCQKYEVEESGQKFPREAIIELAKLIASEQEKHIENGDYED